jgi:hypothetical protein
MVGKRSSHAFRSCRQSRSYPHREQGSREPAQVLAARYSQQNFFARALFRRGSKLPLRERSGTRPYRGNYRMQFSTPQTQRQNEEPAIEVTEESPAQTSSPTSSQPAGNRPMRWWEAIHAGDDDALSSGDTHRGHRDQPGTRRDGK